MAFGSRLYRKARGRLLFGDRHCFREGLAVTALFHQLFCFFLDGTSRHLVRFDDLREDEGYAAAIETPPEAMASSHAVKRFFGAFWWPRIWLFRRLLLHLFLWRLRLQAPSAVILGIDSMVMDNDEARIRHVVTLIRKHYRHDVPILFRLDSGFFDQKLFHLFEELRVGYVCTGKLYDDIKSYAAGAPASAWSFYHTPEQVWRYLEFGDRRGRWTKGRRALKEFGSETLPFKRFAPNAAFYYTMAVAFFLYECFKEDVTEPVVPIASYATRLRRTVIDFAAKVVCTGGRTILKVTRATWNQLQVPTLWTLSRSPPRFSWA